MDDVELAQNLWKRLEEATHDENASSCLYRIHNISEMLCSMMEANGIISEATKEAKTLKTMNKKINMSTHSRTIDNALVFIFLKGLTTLPQKTRAYKYGLIDNTGKLIRQPKTKEEEDCISNLDLLMFRIRKWLMGKVQYLSTVSWIKGVSDNNRLQNMLSNSEMLSRQYIVKKANADLEKLLSKD